MAMEVAVTALIFPSPLSLTLSLSSLGLEKSSEKMREKQTNSLRCCLRKSRAELYLMYEKKQKKKSFWYPFIRELDRQRGRGQLAVESPLLWKENELAFLKGSQTRDEVLERAEGIKKEYNELDTVWFMADSLFKLFQIIELISQREREVGKEREEREMYNSQSQAFLGRKGVLEAVRIAAYCPKRLNRNLVNIANIPSSVDKILQEQIPTVSYRVLGFLLLGIVRIYSKNVQYMYDYCDNLLIELNEFSVKTDTIMETMCKPYPSITQPKSFHLDAFDLQIFEERTPDHIRPSEELMLEGSRKVPLHHSLEEDYSQNNGLNSGTFSAAFTPFSDVLSMRFTEDEIMASPACTFRGSEPSIEYLRKNISFLTNEIPNPIIVNAVEEESQLANEENFRVSNFEKFIGVDEGFLSAGPGAYDDDQDMDDVEKTISKFYLSPENTNNNYASITIDTTPHLNGTNATSVEEPSLVSRYEDNSSVGGFYDEQEMETSATHYETQIMRRNSPGTRTPSFMSALTPAAMDGSIFSRKRKCLLDDICVLPTSVIKESLEDPSDLVRERIRVPHAPLHVWKIQKISNLPHSLSDPIIPYSSRLGSVFSVENLKKVLVVEEATEAHEKMNIIESPIIHQWPEQILNIPESPITNPPPEQMDVAPSLPVTFSFSSTFQDGPHQTISSDSLEEEENDNIEFDVNQSNEDKNSSAGDSWEMDKWSVRTRAAARCLCTKFLSQKKQKEDESANLCEILEGKKKKESARLFYEILVLKSGGYMDVKQEAPYDDIIVEGTSKLKNFSDF